ncbi:MAG TPA: flagellar basal body-associated FliL family protein [Steroidobacteraceae bacterium]|nr:flagellar basal body-associated FliL family protein [Steroidobacteraceae bacterium]
MTEQNAALAAQELLATRSRGKPVLLIAAFFVLLAGGIGAWWWTAHAPKAPSEHPATPALYLALDPPFVVNFESDQLVRFLQITVQLMSHDAQTIELLKSNDPVVRNELLLLFANQQYQVIATREGKQLLRAQALDSVRKVLANAGGHPERLEAVYFTSFVMQ